MNFIGIILTQFSPFFLSTLFSCHCEQFAHLFAVGPLLCPSFLSLAFICKNLYTISIHVTFGISKGIKWDLKQDARTKLESNSKHRRPSRHNSSNIRTLYQFIFHQNPLSFISTRTRDGHISFFVVVVVVVVDIKS